MSRHQWPWRRYAFYWAPFWLIFFLPAESDKNSWFRVRPGHRSLVKDVTHKHTATERQREREREAWARRRRRRCYANKRLRSARVPSLHVHGGVAARRITSLLLFICAAAEESDSISCHMAHTWHIRLLSAPARLNALPLLLVPSI